MAQGWPMAQGVNLMFLSHNCGLRLTQGFGPRLRSKTFAQRFGPHVSRKAETQGCIWKPSGPHWNTLGTKKNYQIHNKPLESIGKSMKSMGGSLETIGKPLKLMGVTPDICRKYISNQRGTLTNPMWSIGNRLQVKCNLMKLKGKPQEYLDI